MNVENILQNQNDNILQHLDEEVNNIIEIDKTKCMASKSIKELGTQCPLNPKVGNIFCGRHRNTKNEDTIDQYYTKISTRYTFKNSTSPNSNSNSNPNSNPNNNPNSNLNNNPNTKTQSKKHTLNKQNGKKTLKTKCKSVIIDLDNFKENPELKMCSKKSIRESYHYYRLDYYGDNKEKNVDVMTIQLKKFFKRLLYFQIPEVEKKLVFLQGLIKKKKSLIMSYYRGPAWNDLTKCNNETDFFNFDKLEEIPPRYRMTYQDEDGFIYGFHIFSLQELLSRKEKNPYTMKEFPEGLELKVNQYISNIKKWLTLDNLNLHYYKNNKLFSNIIKGGNKKDIDNKLSIVDNKVNEELSGNIIEKSQNIVNKLPVKQLSQIQCSQTFSIMTEIGYQVQSNWLYGKSIKQLSRFITYLEYIYDSYNFNNPGLSEEELVNIPLLRFADDIETGNLGTNNKFKLLQRVIEVLNYMLHTLGTGDYKNTISIMIIQALVTLEPTAVRTSNPWLQ